VPANIAEGNRRAGRDRRHLWHVAAGSADEVCAHLRVAEAWGYVSGGDIAEVLALADRVLAMLWRLCGGPR
jgi:four helix bundle protein